ncbi:MAG: helix-turn-helix transcriptional regulator [Ruminococcaceae bacterium]|nr:helix-turn-helix transcriptional regulator [Oscillospiraceae bacterium]
MIIVMNLWKEGNEMRDFSEIAKELRESKHLTQTQLAERMWVKKSIISAYETDARPPSLDMLVKYAKEFNVSTDYLLGIDTSETIKVKGLTDAQINILNDLINEFLKNNK